MEENLSGRRPGQEPGVPGDRAAVTAVGGRGTGQEDARVAAGDVPGRVLNDAHDSALVGGVAPRAPGPCCVGDLDVVLVAAVLIVDGERDAAEHGPPDRRE